MVRFEGFQGICIDSVIINVRESHLRAKKTNMAAKIQDGGQKCLMLWTKKLHMVITNHHAKYGAWCQCVTGISTTASTNWRATMPSEYVMTEGKGL